jgi:hypothetical protein
MNFNITNKPDYSLQARHTHEVINLYGVQTKLLLTEKVNYDASVFGDYQSVKTNKEDTFLVPMMPETSEEYDNIGVNFSEFGMMNVESINMFISRKTVEQVFEDIFEKENAPEDEYNPDPLSPIKKLQSNLVILPNNRVMEITDVEFMVPGINNLFTEQDIKNVYKLTMKTYDVKLTDDLESINDEDNETVGSYKELDSYFDELTDNHLEIDDEAKVQIDEDTEKVVVPPADDVFGRF